MEERPAEKRFRPTMTTCTSLNQITSLTLPNSVKISTERAFEFRRALTSLKLPNSVQSVEARAFEGCEGLTSITLSNSLKTIGNYAFSHCEGLTSLTLPDSLKCVGIRAFSDCRKLTWVSLPHSLGMWDVGEGAFCNCSQLVSVDIRLMSRPALIAWAVGSSHNRDNWQRTSVMRLRNVLALITVLALDPRGVDSVDSYGIKGVFMGCPCGAQHSILPCDDPNVDDWTEFEQAEFDRACLNGEY